MKLLDSPKKLYFSAYVTDPRLVEELRKRCAEQKVTHKKCLEDVLWQTFFPGEPRTENIKPSRMRKVCPICGSHNITEPVNGFPLQCECHHCKKAFDQPLWQMVI